MQISTGKIFNSNFQSEIKNFRKEPEMKSEEKKFFGDEDCSEKNKNGSRNLLENFSDGDFLFRIFFDRKIFEEGNFFERGNFRDGNFENKNPGSEKIRRWRGERGPDRQKRKPQPWAIGEAKHLKILKLLREGKGQRWIARELGVGVQTVQRRADVLRREDDEEGTVDFRKVMGRVCEKHGAVVVWPCVQCLAEEARGMSGRAMWN